MCYWVGTYKVRETLQTNLKSKGDKAYTSLFRNSLNDQIDFPFMERRINIAHSKSELTILKKQDDQYQFDNYRWSLRWSWVKDGKENEGNPLPNIRDKKAVWRHKNLLGTNNCVLPITGYIEFHHQGDETYPFYIFPKEDNILFAAGLYNESVNVSTGEIIKTFGLLTTDPNDRVAKIHNNPDNEGARMLVLLPPERVEEYLDPQKGRNILSFCKAYPQDQLLDHPIPRFLRRENAHLINDDAILQKVEYPELSIV